jgi:hypothetical protein
MVSDLIAIPSNLQRSGNKTSKQLPKKEKKNGYSNKQTGRSMWNRACAAERTWSRWSPPTNLTPSMCSSSSSCSSLSVLVVAGRPVLTLTSRRLPISSWSPRTTQRLTNGLYRCGWSKLRTSSHTCDQSPYQHRRTIILDANNCADATHRSGTSTSGIEQGTPDPGGTAGGA